MPIQSPQFPQTSQIDKIPKVRQFDGNDWFITKTTKRNLPHWELRGSTYFITINVDPLVGKPFLNHAAASCMQTTICSYDQHLYILYAYVIMPEHIHMLIKPLAEQTLSNILHQLKGSSAFNINKLLERRGKFWQKESFDHLVRDDLYMREKWEYIKQNPVTAGLVDVPEKYLFSSFYKLATA